MQTFEVTIDETISDIAPEQALKSLKGVTTVRSTDKSWKDRLHLPGPPLTEAQLEELAEDMNNETEFFTLEEAKALTLRNIAAWKQPISSK